MLQFYKGLKDIHLSTLGLINILDSIPSTCKLFILEAADY